MKYVRHNKKVSPPTGQENFLQLCTTFKEILMIKHWSEDRMAAGEIHTYIKLWQPDQIYCTCMCRCDWKLHRRRYTYVHARTYVHLCIHYPIRGWPERFDQVSSQERIWRKPVRLWWQKNRVALRDPTKVGMAIYKYASTCTCIPQSLRLWHSSCLRGCCWVEMLE